MGEKDVNVKQEANEKKADGVVSTKKIDEGPITVVLKLDLHCAGCAKKVKKSIQYVEGVESVKADFANNKLTITGKVDPGYVKKRVEFKTKKTVEIISPKPKTDDGGVKKGDEKPSEAKPNNLKPKEHQSISTTVVLKIPLHCDGCSQKIKRIVSKIDGVESVKADLDKNLVSVKGTMNMEAHIPYLKDKFKRDVDIITPPKKEDYQKSTTGDHKLTDHIKKSEEAITDKKKLEVADNNGDDHDKKKNDPQKPIDNKEDNNIKNPTTEDDTKKKNSDDEVKSKTTGDGGGSGSGDGDGGGGGDGSKNMDVMNKYEYYRQNPYVYTMPMMYNERYHNQDYGVSVYDSSHGYVNKAYGNDGYVMEYPNYNRPPPAPPSPMSLHDRRGLDSDVLSLENPNACSIM